MTRKKFIVAVVVAALAGMLFGSFLLPAPTIQRRADAAEHSGAFVYEKLSAIYEPLAVYAETRNPEQLETAREIVSRAAVVCVAAGENFGYRDPGEVTSDINQGWCVAFLVWAWEQMEDFGLELTEDQEEVLHILLTVFEPQDGRLDFTTMFWNAGEVLRSPQLPLLGDYEPDPHLIWPES